jgi:colicin import membrane protein
VLLHGALVAILVYGYFQFRRPPPPISALAIDATVVSQATLDAARRPPAPAQPVAPPSPPPQAAAPVPPPDPAAQQAAAQAEAEHQAAAERAEAAQEHAAAQRAADQLAARKHAAAEEAASAAKAQREAQAKAKAKAAEEQTARRAAEAQAKAAAAAKQQTAATQADLQRSIAAEERLDAARASGALSSWAQQIQARIQRAWIRPPSARSGLDCTLYVTQVPGGEVITVRLGACNGDDAVKQSIVDAAYRASPLPPPPDPTLFERNLEVNFRPTD